MAAITMTRLPTVIAHSSREERQESLALFVGIKTKKEA